MMYECELSLKCIFVWENKSLTTAGEFWEDKSRTTAGDKEYVYLQLSRILLLGIPVCCLRKLCRGCIDFLVEEIPLGNVYFCLRSRV